MKELKLYVCDICNTQYKDKASAIQCEKSHKIPKFVRGVKYRSFKSNENGYPDVISVTFDDESIRQYYLK